MHQGGRLERLAGLLPGQPLGGQFPQLVIDQGKELLGRPGVALSDGGKDTGHVVHRSGRRQPPRGIPDLGPGGAARRGPIPTGVHAGDGSAPSLTSVA